MAEGEEGDVYAIVASGRFEIRQSGRIISTLGPGEGLGEIALLRSGVRTATVIALTEGSLDLIDCDVFLAAVAGPTSAKAADAVIDERLSRSAEI
jgi:CRP-like cAMP-binding protein